MPVFPNGPAGEICFCFFNAACRGRAPAAIAPAAPLISVREKAANQQPPVAERPGKHPALEQLNCPEKVRRGDQTTG